MPCPEEVDDLPQIESLILDNNKLTALPSLVKLVNLRELSADRNQISSLRTDLRQCTELRVISLEAGSPCARSFFPRLFFHSPLDA